MDFAEVIKNRHATRYFSRHQVKRSDIKEIIAEAHTAPSWMNAQERKVYIAVGDTAKTVRTEFEERSKSGMIGISDFTEVHRNEWSQKAQNNMYNYSQSLEKELGDKLDDFVHSQDTIYNAPALLYLTLPKNPNRWAILDLGAFEQTILLSATNRGIDSIVSYAIIKYPDIIRKHLPIPEEEEIAIGIALGYADDGQLLNRYRTDRVDINDVLYMR